MDPAFSMPPNVPSAPPSSVLSQGNTAVPQFEAMDVPFMSKEVRLALEYVTETRADFDAYGPQPEIDTLVALIQETKQAVRDIEVRFMSELGQWKDENGIVHDVLLRSFDTAGFDRTARLFLQMQEQFDRYFKKHILLMKKEKERGTPQQYFR